MMRRLTVSVLSLFFLCVTVVLAGFSTDAEARRLGGGRSFGMQRQATPAPAPAPAPAPSVAPNAAPKSPATAAAPASTPPRRSWMGPLAGLAAGLGLAALASHFGFGEELASFMLMALLALVVLFVLRRVFAPARQANAMAYAGNSPATATQTAAAFPAGASGAAIPPDFDQEGFARQAKLNFIRMQAANDRGDLNDLREFTTPEFFAEIALQFDERGRHAQQTDVVTLDAEVLEAVTEGTNHVVSVRFHGLLREEGGDQAATPFDEVWHLVKPTDGNRGWVVAGIQQRH